MNSNLPAGAENDPNAPWNNEEEYECTVCGKRIFSYGICNSRACFEADNM